MAAAEMDLDAAFALPEPVGGGAVAQKTTEAEESRWTSTSSVESTFDNFWHDSSAALDHFYTTQDTATTLESFDFNDENLFFGPFDSCSTRLSNHHQTQDSARHVTEASAAGVESFDFACAPLNTIIPDLQPPAGSVEDAFDLSAWSIPTAHGETTSTLKNRLNNAMVRGDGGRLFVPEDVLRAVLSQENVVTELQKKFPAMSPEEQQQLAAQITGIEPRGHTPLATGLLRTFATLVLLDKAHKITDFFSEGLADNVMPLMRVKVPQAPIGEPLFQLRRRDMPGVQLRCLRGWSQADVDTLEKLQWRVCSPIFSDIKEQEGNFLDLQDETVLPYVESWEDKKHDHYKGGNSEVWKVKIHEAHHTFHGLGAAPALNPYFAIKKLRSKDDEAFRREVRNLLRLHNAEHPNLVSLLATYKYRGYYHLVFPWADGDLRRLWQSTPNPSAGKDEMRWLAGQCASIASALRSVHAGAESWVHGAGDRKHMAMNKFGIHGDIKPENIFIFSKGQQKRALAMGLPQMSEEGSTSSSGGGSSSACSSRGGSPSSSSSSSVADEFVMSIGDFGGGEFFDPSTNPDPLRQITVAYRPPEYDTKLRPVSRSWDIWGLGCTYLEFVTWFLLGPSGLTEFARRRTTRTAAGKLSDEYFETRLDESQTGGVAATLKDSVLAWINELYRHKNASQFIRDFLDYITHRMFIVENASLTRASGDEVADHLNNLTRRCFDSDAYCLPSPAISSPRDTESTSSSSSSNDLHVLSSGSLDEYISSDFNPTTEDATSAWNFSSLDDVVALNQWNTAPIMPTGNPYKSLSCEDLLGSWNHTAPVAWNYDTTNSGPSSGKRKRCVEDVTEDLDRRVSPKTSTTGPSGQSPRTTMTTTSGSPATVESPVVETNGKKAEKRFACPYYKNNAAKFRQKRTCCGPGWPTVHRVKEHLYRCHTIGKHTCSRCMKRCKSAAELLAHQRADVRCETRSDAFPEGTMMPSQEEALRVKKRVPPNTAEEQRWNEIYVVLFPESTPDSLPTPFYEDDTPPPPPSESRSTRAAGTSSSPPAARPSPDGDAWFCSPSDYERYLGRGLPARVRRELEGQVRREFGFVGTEGQVRRVVDMVQEMQVRLFRQFQQEARDLGLGRDGDGRGRLGWGLALRD